MRPGCAANASTPAGHSACSFSHTAVGSCPSPELRMPLAVKEQSSSTRRDFRSAGCTSAGRQERVRSARAAARRLEQLRRSDRRLQLNVWCPLAELSASRVQRRGQPTSSRWAECGEASTGHIKMRARGSEPAVACRSLRSATPPMLKFGTALRPWEHVVGDEPRTEAGQLLPSSRPQPTYRLPAHTRRPRSSVFRPDKSAAMLPPRAPAAPAKRLAVDAPAAASPSPAKRPRAKTHLCAEDGCGAAFHSPARLREHERSHTGEVRAQRQAHAAGPR
jgi:hypothetical protein